MKGEHRLRKWRDGSVRLARRIRRKFFRSETAWDCLSSRDSGVWGEARRKAAGGPRVLIATATGGHRAVTPVESLLGVALTLRGAEVHFLLCDGVLPACLQAAVGDFPEKEFAEHGPAKTMCGGCIKKGDGAYRPLGLPVHHMGSYLVPDDYRAAEFIERSLKDDELGSCRHEGLAIGEHAIAGALRYFARGTLEGEAEGNRVLRRYFRASLLTAFSVRRLLKRTPFGTSVFNHGIYVPHGIIGEVARDEGVAVVNWNAAYRKKSFIFSHGDTYHHTLMSEPVSNWESMRWDGKMNDELMSYLKSRWRGTQDWIWFHEKPELDERVIAEELGIDPSKPRIGMLTNVMWDAQLHYPANAFPNMKDWMLRTIAHFAGRPDLQLVIRVHPAEVRGTTPSRQPVVDEIRRAFPKMPKNVFVIGPESRISTYAVMLRCDTALIYGTKTGVELTSVGIPVIVAGEAWIRGKGITLDAQSAEHYFRLLDMLPLRKKLSEAEMLRARKYAYHFFFRRMIPVGCLEPRKGWPPFKLAVDRLESLAPGADPGLDVICDGITSGRDFIFSPDAPKPAGAGRMMAA